MSSPDNPYLMGGVDPIPATRTHTIICAARKGEGPCNCYCEACRRYYTAGEDCPGCRSAAPPPPKLDAVEQRADRPPEGGREMSETTTNCARCGEENAGSGNCYTCARDLTWMEEVAKARAAALREGAELAREHCTVPRPGHEPCEDCIRCECCVVAARLDALAEEAPRA